MASYQQDENRIICQGVVVESLRNATFRVKLDNGQTVLVKASGKMRMRYVRVLLGDRVTVQLSKYDLTKGRIVYREKVQQVAEQ